MKKIEHNKEFEPLNASPLMNLALVKTPAILKAVLAGFIIILAGLTVVYLHSRTQHKEASFEQGSPSSTALDSTDLADKIKAQFEAQLQQRAQAQPHQVASHQIAKVLSEKTLKAQAEFLIARMQAPTNAWDQTTTSIATSNLATSSIIHNDVANNAMNTSNNLNFHDESAFHAQRISHPDRTIVAGTLIFASLNNAINTEFPGMITATVSEPIYAFSGKRILIPADSQLNGEYVTANVEGQSRIFIIWDRIILPNNTSIQLNSPGVDALGRGGVAADSVNTHFIARFGMASLLSMINLATSTVGVNNTDQYNSSSAYRQALGQSFQQSASQNLQNTIAIKPTLYGYQGKVIQVMVAHDLAFYE
ncbi:MAG: TrbI/VirB10 family protein [Legionellales bacterium]|nr:TrbI/VirB10 family protein [Legionellales bacterium]